MNASQKSALASVKAAQLKNWLRIFIFHTAALCLDRYIRYIKKISARQCEQTDFSYQVLELRMSLVHS